MPGNIPGNIPGEILLDVSELEPPEPLEKTLDAAEELANGQYLRMLHRRDPCLLYGNLNNNGFKYFQRQGATTAVELFIWRKDDADAAMAVAAIIGTSVKSSS